METQFEQVESTWKALFQRRVVMAAKHCHSVHEHLLVALEAVDADVQNRRRHQGPRAAAAAAAATRALEGASMQLGLAVASMGAARHLALQGAAPCPSAPLDSVDDLAAEPGVWCAVEKLGNAAALATRVHEGVECARGHLRAAELVVVLDGGGDASASPCGKQSPCLPDQFIAEALLKATDLATEIDDAHEAAFGGVSTSSASSAATEVWSTKMPIDLLQQIATHLDDAADFVRFHAVCKLWRSAAWPARNTLLPWLLAPRNGNDDRLLRFRLIFTGSTVHLPYPASLVDRRSIVMDTNSVGTCGRLLIIGPAPAHDACFANPLSGAATPLPQLPEHLWLDQATCSVSTDGSAVVMCTAPPPCSATRIPVVLATMMMMMRQEDQLCNCKWVDVVVHWPALQSRPSLFYALHHHGLIICGDEEASTCICAVPMPDKGFYRDRGTTALWVRPPPLPAGKTPRSTFVLESGEDLLLARVLIPTYMLEQKHKHKHRPVVFSDEDPVCHHLSVSVHALKLPGNGGGRDGEVCWRNKDLSLGDRALFLSPHSSFAMEGVRAAGSGCAYFIFEHVDGASQEQLCCVYRYEFMGGIASLVEKLPQGWDSNSVWFAPRPGLRQQLDMKHYPSI